MAIKSALRLRAKQVFSAAQLQTLYSEVAESGKIFCIQQTTWEINKTTSGGNTRCRLYIDGHGYKIPLAEQDAPAANVLYEYPEKVWLVPGERLALDIDQAQATTLAEMHNIGYWTTQKEGIQ